MTLYEELKARGLVAQITDEEIIDLINNGKATFYIGFDCTADSLTAGHFLALTLMKRLQLAGNKPIALIGGGTTMIGDLQPEYILAIVAEVGDLRDAPAGGCTALQRQKTLFPQLGNQQVHRRNAESQFAGDGLFGQRPPLVQQISHPPAVFCPYRCVVDPFSTPHHI